MYLRSAVLLVAAGNPHRYLLDLAVAEPGTVLTAVRLVTGGHGKQQCAAKHGHVSSLNPAPAFGLLKPLAEALLIGLLGELSLAKAPLRAGNPLVQLLVGGEKGLVCLGDQRVERPLQKVLLDGSNMLAFGLCLLVDGLEEVLAGPHDQLWIAWRDRLRGVPLGSELWLGGGDVVVERHHG